MGRIYAGILGPLALVVVVIRDLRHGGGGQSTMITASLCLLGFAAVGYTLGEIARWIVDDSVRGRAEAELAKRPGTQNQSETASAAPQTTGP